jgi:hypothetical protein
MKMKLLAVSVLLLLASAVTLHADTTPVDPRMAITDPECDDCGVGSSFSFFSDAAGGGLFTFQNESDVDWTSLLFVIPTGIQAADVMASSVQFANAPVIVNIGNFLEIYFSGVNNPPGCELGCFPGITQGQIFTIELNDQTGTDGGGWGPGLEFDATANVPSPVPEPATLTLLGIGLTALAAKMKLRGKAKEEDTELA